MAERKITRVRKYITEFLNFKEMIESLPEGIDLEKVEIKCGYGDIWFVYEALETEEQARIREELEKKLNASAERQRKRPLPG